MFETKTGNSRTPSGGSLAMQFLAQQILATIGTLIVSYPIFREVEIPLIQHSTSSDESALWAWRWIAVVIPMIVGFGIGAITQSNWQPAYRTGRFVGIIPTLVFLRDLIFAASFFSLTKALENRVEEAGGLEMWLGSLFYSLGVYWAHNRMRRSLFEPTPR